MPDENTEIVFYSLMSECADLTRKFDTLSYGSNELNLEHGGEPWLDHLRQLATRGQWIVGFASPEKSGAEMISTYYREGHLYPALLVCDAVREMLDEAVERVRTKPRQTPQ